jgi:hypothetical protein
VLGFFAVRHYWRTSNENGDEKEKKSPPAELKKELPPPEPRAHKTITQVDEKNE